MFSPLVIVSVLSLFSCTHAVALGARGDDCTYCCPKTDVYGKTLSTSSPVDDKFICCTYDGDGSYGGKTDTSCTYDIHTGYLVGDSDDCLKKAKKDCYTPRSREFKQAVARGAVGDTHAVVRKREGTPSLRPKRDVPYSSSDKPYPYSDKPYPSSDKPPYSQSNSWSKPSSNPYPSPTWKPTPSEEPCSFRCPIKDLAKNPLTDEAIRTPSLFCSYPSSKCQSCNFCEYDTKTGKLKKDNDDGYCPKTGDPVRPWDRRFI